MQLSHASWLLLFVTSVEQAPILHQKDSVFSDPFVESFDTDVVSEVFIVALLAKLDGIDHLNDCHWEPTRAVGLFQSI